MFYKIYKILFRVLTGKTISFGNFCLIPKAVLDRIVNQPDLWNNIPSTITRSNFPIKKIESERGKRYQGKSKMNFSSLFVLGLSAFSVYIDLLIIRVILLWLMLIAIIFLSIIVLLILKVFTELTIPGWTSIMLGNMFLFLGQSVIIGFFTLTTFLNNRTANKIIPAKNYRDYIRSVKK